MEAHVVYQFRAYTDREGFARVDEVLAQHRDLYNAALQERKWAWEWQMKGGDPAKARVDYFTQSKELTAIRSEDSDWAGQNRRLATGTLRRLDHAFQAFFRRVAEGKAPGYPRLKSLSRFRTLETRGIPPGALRVHPGKGTAVVGIKGLPHLKLELKGRTLPPTSQLKTLRITRKGRRCVVSLGFAEQREPLQATGAAVGLDMRLGIGRVVTSDRQVWGKRETDTKKKQRMQRRISRARKGSKSRGKRVRALANFHYQEQISDRNAVHRFTTQMVRRYDLIAVEDLDIQQMTGSARGTIAEPGTLVAHTADLNRRALEQTWGEIRRQLTYKAEWAGRQLLAVDPADTSRTCSSCGAVRSLPQISSTFRCRFCGTRGSASHNAAVNILRLGLRAAGEGGSQGPEPALGTPLDVAPIGAMVPMRV